ncbi:hypothetical protein Psed_0907 [Pseudonocardia dioxanivorans CB1190]|uniref:Uncharacterized protein n=1 Tax=Pseudonocardia dioxanivorans (strain ATCC 55486 / DSM 44775 / JCM 13855 / CB1190) TaxID=675635 RepID=F4CTY6_PSEUX|nr:hypothetical protein [Pseudonocardia dioxanivorans]AEA23161.1 hypothetical protein Psed_0907 [Pseudonocardia dioxanivorans CB1190]
MESILARTLAILPLGVLAVGLVTACSDQVPPPTAPAAVTAPAAPPTTVQATTPDPTPPPTPAPARPTAPKANGKPKVAYSCEPNAPAKFGDPAHPNTITNKSCPALNAAKERAARDYQRKLDAEHRAVSDAALQACREQTGQTTAQCQAQARAGLAS